MIVHGRRTSTGILRFAALAAAGLLAFAPGAGAQGRPGESRLAGDGQVPPYLAMDAGGSGSPFSTPNPYALPGATTVRDVQVGRAIVFGDSYSITRDDPYGHHSRWPFEMWNEQLVREGLFAELANYAIGGSIARSCRRRSLCTQYRNWRASDGTFRDGDLTILYFGQNDLRNPGRINSSIGSYRKYLKRLRRDGATADGRKMMVALIPDWGKRPIGTPEDSQNTVTFNRKLANVSRKFRREMIAVDLYTAFEHVYADPAKFGLTNVTTADPAAATDTSILFYDDEHFGRKGNDITATVFRHYLTEGWNWAARVKAGPKATRRFEKDLANGLVFGFPAFAVDAGVVAFRFGTVAEPASTGEAAAPTTRWDFDRWDGRTADGGTGVAYRLGPDTRLSFAAGTYGEQVEIARTETFGRTGLTSRAFGITLEQRALGLDWVTRIDTARGRFTERRWHAVTGEVTRGSGETRDFAVGQAVEAPFRLGGFGFTPWVELAFERSEVGSYAIADPLLGRTRFGEAQVDQLVGAFGLRFATPEWKLGEGLSFGLAGSLERRIAFGDGSTELMIREGLTGRTERVSFGRSDEWVASAGARLALGPDTALELSWSLVDRADEPRDQTVSGRFTFRF